MTYLAFARQSKDEEYSRERVLNWFLRASDNLTNGVLIERSCLVEAAEPASGVRAIIEMAGDLYAVASDTVWRYVIATGALSNVGTVLDSGGAVSMAASGEEVAIVTADTYYICDGSTTTSYSTGALTKPQWVVFTDGYFVVSGTVQTRDDAITVSALDDGTTFNALDFAFAENAPDAIRGLAVLNNRVWVFGGKTTEKFWNSGNVDFPFEPSRSEFLNRGILDGRTVSEIDNSLCWVGQNKIVYRSMGGAPAVISTPEIKGMLDRSTILGAFSFYDKGHEFYAIRRKSHTTLCYDVTTGLWCERSTGVTDGPWVATCVAEYDGEQYFGTSTGKICTQSADVHEDDGETVRCEAVSVPLVKAGQQFDVSEISVTAKTTNMTINGAAPQIMMQTSRNGMEWGTEKWRSLGGVGEYNKRITWDGLGTFRRAQVKFRVTDPVPRDLYGIAYG